MRRRAKLVIVGAALFSLQALAQAPEQNRDMVFEGVAASPEDGGVLYRERHRVSGLCLEGQWHPEQHKVDYLRPDTRDTFASKQLRFPAGLIRPEVDFRQPAFDERLKISVNSAALDILWSKGDDEKNQWSVDLARNLVVDAGFDHFIRQNWATLTSGEDVEFRFLAPTRGKAYDFVAEPDPEPIPGADYGFRIRPTGLILRLAVDPIRLGYREDGFLTHYSGLGNVRRNQDENYKVTIEYALQSAPPCALPLSS